MKDPAVLWYYQDFLVGTEFMTDEEVGKYTRILCHQADKGHLTKTQILSICKTNEIPGIIAEKLVIDEEGNYYQNRMQIEKDKRKNNSEKQRKRIQDYWDEKNKNNEYDGNTTELPNNGNTLENENENENIIKKKEELLKKREEKFCNEVYYWENIEKYPKEMLQKFYNYWTEKNPSKTKMRFELQKTFEIAKRLATWAGRDKEIIKTQPDSITYKELVYRFNEGETDIWDKYEPVNPGDKRTLWKRK